MPLTTEQRNLMIKLEGQMLKSGAGKAEPLTDEERDWFESATQALLTGEDVDGLPAVARTPLENHKTAMVQGNLVTPVEAEVIEEPEPNPEDIKQQIVELKDAMLDMAGEQGTRVAIEKAMKEYGDDLYLAQQRGIVIAFRPMYWDEVDELNTKSEKDADKWLVEQCVVVGLEKVVGKRARGGVYANLARKILQVSDQQGDMNDIIVPTSY